MAKRYGAREPNESAAKDWLSNLEVPWLLIIDDAASDDSGFLLKTLFPEGGQGHILITTRDESHKVHGTVGPKSFEFGNMDSEPATDLLLKAACAPKPWDVPTKESASFVTKTLGYLPLALVYAGRAIMDGLCTLQDYVRYYTTSWQRIQQARDYDDDHANQDLYMSIYSGFEIVYLALKDKRGQAASVQTIVKNFVCEDLGTDHPNAIRIEIALSLTYRAQGRGTEAANLQETVLGACISSLGKDDATTLKVMDALGESNWQLGHFKVAKRLHRTAIDRLTQKFGPEHEDTLRASDHLGRVELYYQNYDEAKELHAKALEGMLKAENLGPGHLDTLTAQENLAIAYMLIGEEKDIQLAHKLMVDVVGRRKEKLGKEHPWTLLSRLNLARVRSAQGFYEEAEEEIRTGSEIARRNLGPEHGGTLFGEARLGQVLLRQERYREAENLLQRIPRYYKRMATASDGAHPDRLIAMLLMVHCYRLQQKYEAAIDTCDECIRRLESISDVDHPFMTRLKYTRDALCDPDDRGKALSDDWKTR